MSACTRSLEQCGCDRQVSFREFYKMCIHPNPAQYDCRATKEAEMIGQEQAKKCEYPSNPYLSLS